MKRLLWSFLIALVGVTIHMTGLAIAERTAASFPTISDVLIDRLPAYNLYGVGELYFLIFLIAFALVFLRTQFKELPRLLVMLGLLYGIRGLFLLFLPIGPPLGAPLSTDRFTFYPYASHAYFPGGHIGLLFLMASTVAQRRYRLWFMVAAIIFGLGSLLAKAHYTADVLGGIVLAYAVKVWSDRHLQHWRLP